jgi:type IV secretory pathway TraG/TraD family ATPase VirD4
MRSHVFYRPADMVTAGHLEQRIGRTVVATHTRSRTRHPGTWSPTTTESVGEREAPLLLAQDALQLAEDHALAFTAGRPPLLLERGDWRQDRALSAKLGLPLAQELPIVPPLPPLEPAAPEEREPVLLHGLDD